MKIGLSETIRIRQGIWGDAMETIIATTITAICALGGTCITAFVSNSKNKYRLEQIEKKLDKQTELIERIYKLEERVAVLEHSFVSFKEGVRN